MVRSEGNMSLKNPVTPPGIYPGTIRLVAQRLNHYATPGPNLSVSKYYTSITETAICMIVNLLICCLFNDFISISDNISLSLHVAFLCDIQMNLKPKHVTQCIKKHCTGVVVIDCPSSPFLIWHCVRGSQVNNEFGRNVEGF